MQIPELAAKIQALGLTDKQARVYVAALFLGSASAQKIAEQAGVNRATGYVILDELIELGLVSQSQDNKKTVFIGEGVEALEQWLGNQEHALGVKRSELKNIAPELRQAERVPGGEAPQVRFFRGVEGVTQMSGYLRRKAKPGSTIYAMTNVDEVRRLIPDVIDQNPQQRLKKRLSSKLFYSYSKSELSPGKKLRRQQVKLDEPIAADINLYEDAAIMSTYGAQGSIGVVIESPEIVAALRQLFDLAWGQSDNKSSKKRQ